MKEINNNKKYVSDDPRLLAEWAADKNSENGLYPDKVSHGSTKYAFWVCNKGHEFKARVDHRFIMGSNCPYCAGKRPVVGVNDFATLYPELLVEWDYEKNLKQPQEYLPFSNKKVWWICAQNHSWQTGINHRASGHGCPECAIKERVSSRISALIDRTGSLRESCPQIVKEWDIEKNLPLTPDDVTAGSNKYVWWLCSSCGTSYRKTIASRAAGGGCAVCVGKKVLTGYNDLKSKFPDIAKEWNYDLNDNLLPSDITAGNDKKVWWHCSVCGYDWQSAIHSRTGQNTGCPACAGRVVVKGQNDLTTTHPNLVAEWYSDKNRNLTPEDVTAGSNKRVWWKCENGHIWQAKVCTRVKGRGCPYCAQGKRLIARLNTLVIKNGSLYDNNFAIAKEWHPLKNGQLLPTSVTSGSDRKVWWQCEQGHSWQATISSRVSGNGCPICSGEKSTSFPEQAIFYYLAKVTMAINRYKCNNIEIDVFLPDLNVGVEYNGRYYHKARHEKDLKKVELLSKMGIRVIRIEEGDEDKRDKDVLYYKYTDRHYRNLDTIIDSLCRILNLPLIDVDIMRDSKNIYESYVSVNKLNSVAAKYPGLIEEWNTEKNGKLSPWQISYGASKKVWWKCKKCNYEWEAVVSSRRKSGCPCCASRVIVAGVNDMASKNPKLAEEWNYDKNDLLPTQVSSNSHNHVWWRCEKGHEWIAEIKSRNQGCGCPTCYKLGLKKYSKEGEL